MQAICHPDKTHYSRNLCRSCYNKEPDIKARDKLWTKTSPVRKAWTKKYEKSLVRARTFRKQRHAFTVEDEVRFINITCCDWCAFPFGTELPHIDHDKRCCSKPCNKHCRYCTRGFVHQKCNAAAIMYYEWLERTFGFTDEKLKLYRERFPVPRRIL